MIEKKREELYDTIKAALNITQNPLVVCIAGASCSGKSTLAYDVKGRFSEYNPTIICQDDWFKNMLEIPRDADGYFDMECENAFCKDEFVNDIKSLFSKGYMYKPKYDIATNMRVAKDEFVENGRLTIIEGLHTILWMNDIKKNLDNVDTINFIYVWINGEKELCSKRRAERDIKFINKDISTLRNFYENIIYPHYQKYIEIQTDLLSKCDFIMKGDDNR